MTLDNSVRRRFAWPVRAIHWISAGLVLVAYLTTELAEEAEHGEAVGINWHVAAGLALLLLFVPRLLAKLLPRPGPLMPPAPNWTRLPHALVTLALLLFVLVQPVLGCCWCGPGRCAGDSVHAMDVAAVAGAGRRRRPHAGGSARRSATRSTR